MPATLQAPRPASSPLGFRQRSRPWQLGAVLAGTFILALSSHIKVPFYPVPMTLQTLAVPLIGALYGWRLGMVTVLAWLGQAALGAPVLAGPTLGIGAFAGPTAGYLFAFPLAAALAGWLAERGWSGPRMRLSLLNMLLANALCLVLGTAWLATLLGLERALMAGFYPFLLGALVKSALGACLLRAMSRFRTDDGAGKSVRG